MEQWYELIRGEDGKGFRCGKDDFDHQSSFGRFDRVRFDSIWWGHGQFKAVNIRPASSQAEWDQWRAECRSRCCAEDKAPPVDDSCASTDAGTEATPELVNPEVRKEVRKLLKKLREIDALVGRQDLEANQQAKIEMREQFQKRLDRLMG